MYLINDFIIKIWITSRTQPLGLKIMWNNNLIEG